MSHCVTLCKGNLHVRGAEIRDRDFRGEKDRICCLQKPIMPNHSDPHNFS